MFNGLGPGFDEEEVPISSIPNGVHAPTWLAREVFELAARSGADVTSDRPDVWEVADQVSPAQLWTTKRILRERLVEDVRSRLRTSWSQRGEDPAGVGWFDTSLDRELSRNGSASRRTYYNL